MIEAFLVTWVTYNSRVSERMIEFGSRNELNLVLTDELEVIVTKVILDIINKDVLKVFAYNICRDHVHMVIACDYDRLPNIIRKIKGKSAQRLKEYLGIDADVKFHLWAQKYHKLFVTDQRKLENVIAYVKFNRMKHGLDINKGLQPLVNGLYEKYMII